MCKCRPEVRTPCCGSEACHGLGKDCPWCNRKISELKIAEVRQFFFRERYAILEAAELSKSGGFVLGIADAIQHADPINYQKMIDAFPEYFIGLYDFYQRKKVRP